MSDGAALLAAIRREPDDDELRLAYADWLDEHGDPDRAEFIRAQIAAERHRVGSPEHTRLTDRAAELLNRHGRRWSAGYEAGVPADAEQGVSKRRYAGSPGLCLEIGKKHAIEGQWDRGYLSLQFHRGFVDQIPLSPESYFALSPSDLNPAGPLPTLTLQVHNRWDTSEGELAGFVGRLAASPLLNRFRDVAIHGGFGGFTADHLRQLANEPALLAKLAGLRVSEERVGDADVLPILTSPLVTGLHDLCIDYTNCTQAVVDLLVRSGRFRGMTYLHLDDIIDRGRGLRLFAAPGRWPRLRWLCLGSCGIDDLSLRGLTRPGAFPALEMLDLCFNAIHAPAVRALLRSGAAPMLRLLGLGGTSLTIDEVQALRDEFGPQVELFYPVPRQRSQANEEPPTSSEPPRPS